MGIATAHHKAGEICGHETGNVEGCASGTQRSPGAARAHPPRSLLPGQPLHCLQSNVRSACKPDETLRTEAKLLLITAGATARPCTPPSQKRRCGPCAGNLIKLAPHHPDLHGHQSH